MTSKRVKNAKHYTKAEAASRVETRKKKLMVKRTAMIAAFFVLAAALYFAGRILYLGVINPGAAFDTSLHTESITPQAALPSFEPIPDETEVFLSTGPSTSPVIAGPSPAVSSQATPVETPSPAASSQQSELSQADLEFIKDKVNILLVGVDENPDREKTRVSFRSDVLLLLCIDFNQKNVHMLSIPRDSYAAIYNTKGKWKINAAFAHGGGISGYGFQYAMISVSNLLGGIPINYYVGVQMEGLKKLIDALGGIEYKVDIPVKMNGRYLKKGLQHLTGQQVLDYCRIRKGIGTDINRVDRQQRLLLSLFQQLQKENKLELVPKAFSALKDDIYTNMSLEQFVALAVFANNMDAEKIERHTLKGKYMMAYGSNYYFLDQAAKADVVYDIFKIKIKSDYKYDAGYVKAFTEASDALTNADKLLAKYKKEITDTQKTQINTLKEQTNTLLKKLPSGEDILARSVKELNSLCYQVEIEIKNPAAAASASASASPAAPG